ncbi:MAG: LytR/AlgR family response regulator transcription factor [Cyclobacteriaceae bacterium]|jgi:two-component system response regulator LytT
MITCAIIDDDHMSRLALDALTKRVRSINLKGSFSSAVEARHFLQEEPVDLIFVDVEMPELSGLDFIRTLTKRPEIIITSAKEKYALEAFEVEVADFLLKPVSLERFLKTMNRIEIKLASAPKATNGSLYVKANNQLINLSLSAINYVEAYGDYVNIYTEKERFIVHGTMKGMESKLPADEFARVHRSHIVRLDKINAIEETVIIIGKKLIPIGDSYRHMLMNQLSFL